MSLLKFKSVEIHFIYSFALDIPKSDEIPRPLEHIQEVLNRSKSYAWKGDCKPPQRVGVPSNLRMKPEGKEIYCCQQLKEPVVLKGLRDRFDDPGNRSRILSAVDDKDVSPYEDGGSGQACEILTRIFEAGSGTFTLKLTIDALDTLELLRIFDLVNPTEDEEEGREYQTISIQGKDVRLIDLVKNKLEDLEGKLENMGWDTPWLDRKLLLIDADPDFQNPYIFLRGSLCDGYSERPDWHCTKESWMSKESENRLKEFSLLLYRYLKGFDIMNQKDPWYEVLTFPPAEQTETHFLRDFSWYKHIYIGMHSRAAMVIGEDAVGGGGNGSAKVHDEVMRLAAESSLDLLETLRARWHLTVVINELLDTDLEYVRHMPSPEQHKYLKRYLKRVEQFALLLSEPLAYSYEGGLLADLQGHAKVKFGLKELRDGVLAKFGVLDRLMNAAREKFHSEALLADVHREISREASRPGSGIDGK